MEETKKKRGGKREGAGRPKGADTTLISVKLETELLNLIPNNTNRSKYINYAVRYAYNNKERFEKYVQLKEKEKMDEKENKKK